MSRGNNYHLSHQYELYKTPGTKFTWLVQNRRKANSFARGDLVKHFGIDMVPYYESGKYDVALLHLDQQCFEDSIMERGKGSLTRELDETIQDIPKIFIMHGTPYYPEMFKNDVFDDDFAPNGISSELIKRFKKFVGSSYVVTNSRQAARQWGIGQPIWHAMDPDEWFDLPKEPRVVTMINPGGLDKYYDRLLLRGVKEELEERHIFHCHITVDVMFNDFDEYRDFLGRSLVYFNPTKESPMPRSRTEAMLGGSCVVSMDNHDVSDFIENGKSGILLKKRNPKMIADIIEGLIYDYNKAIDIGQAGKKIAQKMFVPKRYQDEWRKLLETAVENK